MKIPQNPTPVVHVLTDAIGGADDHPEVPLKQITPAVLRAILKILVGELPGPNNVPPGTPGLIADWGTAKTVKRDKSADLRSAISNGRAKVLTCINSLKPVFGAQWNSQWNQAGFINGSIAVPENPEVILMALRAFYMKNPTREVKGVNGIDCTADACQAAADAIAKAEDAANESVTALAKVHQDLEAAVAQARLLLSGLQAELKQLLAADDPRWLSFGFDMPGHHGGPEVPRHLVVTPGTAGTLFAHCDDARRAEGYRFKVLDAADEKNVLAEQLTHDPQATFEQLTTGANVKVIASARNATGESQPCAAVAATVP